MRSLYLRIYATVVLVLLLFALVAGWLFQRNMEHNRIEGEAELVERFSAWGDLAQNNLPPASAPVSVQREAVLDWSQRLGVPMALDDGQGARIATSPSFAREEGQLSEGAIRRRGAFELALHDGRVLWVLRRPPPRMPSGGPSAMGGGTPREAANPSMVGERDGGRDRWRGLDGAAGMNGPGEPGPRRGPPPFWAFANGGSLVIALALLFVAVAAGAWPVVRRLTRRLELLKSGVEAFGAGALDRRVQVDGSDEVAALATSFNLAASRVETLVRSHQSLLANASHELRSPLARMKMAVSMLDIAATEQRASLKTEINTNIAELDGLVEEVLMASRLDASAGIKRGDSIDVRALAEEEGSRAGALVEGGPVAFVGNERLLRRALRNLLENATRYGGGDVVVEVKSEAGRVWIRVCDRGPGVPDGLRERIFEPFYRLPGHAEQAGGVGLGLSLVRQIAERHDGAVHWEAREGGGSCFVLSLPAK